MSGKTTVILQTRTDESSVSWPTVEVGVLAHEGDIIVSIGDYGHITTLYITAKSAIELASELRNTAMYAQQETKQTFIA